MKNKKLMAVMLATAVSGALMMSAMAMASEISEDMVEAAVTTATSPAEGVVIEGEVGDTFEVGDLIFEIVSDEEIEKIQDVPVTRASTSRFSITLSGSEHSEDFEVTTNYPWAKVWVDNRSTGDIKFTITKGSKTGYVVRGSDVTIKAGTKTSVYATKEWDPDIYYANFTCGKATMSGTASCRVASTQHELDI